jgi:hypothetical protein
VAGRPKDSDGVDFIKCRNCDSPCYSFEIDPRRGVIVEAHCALCGNDDPAAFTVPEDSEA